MINLTETWVPTQAEFDTFAQVSGDDNPIHVNPDFSARTGFGRTVSHGMLIYSKLWGLLKRHHPQAQQISHDMMFPAPTFVGDEVRLEVFETAPNHLTLRALRPSDGAELLLAQSEITQ